MKNAAVETFNTTTFLERYTHPDPRLRQMVREHYGAFFIVDVQEMLRASRLPIPPVRSTGHSLIFLTDGEANMRIGFQPHRITRHQCLAVAAGQVFSYDRLEENTGYLVHFTDAFLTGLLGKAEQLLEFDFLQAWGHAAITLGDAAATAVAAMLDRMLAAFDTREPQAQPLCQAYLVAVLRELGQADAATRGGRAGKAHALSNRFKELLSRQFREVQRVQAYADLLAVSPNHLNKAVKAATGKSPSRWIDEAIVLEAKVLLYQTDLPVGEIASGLGIDDNSYFSRLFKRYAGMSPMAFRNRIDPS